MRKKNDKLDELAQLTQELHRVRRESLAASRSGDYRTVARLTGEAARLNRMILAAEGSGIASLVHLGHKLFSGDSDSTFEQPVQAVA